MYEETGGGSGTSFVYNEPYNYPDSKYFPPQQRSGQYTYKIHKLWDRLPWWLRLCISGPKAELHEESWNAGKFVKTVMSFPNLFQDKFSGYLSGGG